MKASLQPKEAQIEAQNEKFLELIEQFDKQNLKITDFGKDLTKNQSKINQL